MLVTLVCGLLLVLGGAYGVAKTCSYGGGNRQASDAFAGVAMLGMAVTLIGLLWGLIELAIFIFRAFRDSRR